MLNPKAADLWRRYLAETDPQAADMLYREYLQALGTFEPVELPPDFIRLLGTSAPTSNVLTSPKRLSHAPQLDATLARAR